MNCSVAADLLPLYHDGVCSDESRVLVEAHLAQCPACRAVLAALDAPARQTPPPDDGAAVRALARGWKRRRRRAVWLGALLAGAVLVLAGALWLWLALAGGSFGFRPAADGDAQYTGEIQYYYNPVSRRCFAAAVRWDSEAQRMDVTVPDTLFGYPVTALGGWYGRGVPTRFGLQLPAEWTVWESFDAAPDEDPAAAYPEAQVVELPVSLHLGENVSQLALTGPDGYVGLDADGRLTVWLVRWDITCAAENETFYAENGRLYTRADGACVWDQGRTAG